jgi:hypothetical protein
MEIDMSDNEFDSGANAEQNGINIVRNKTFNTEFRQLVNKVIGKDSETENRSADFSGIDDLPEEELLKRLYKLHYMSKSLIDNRDINVSFRPFELDREMIRDGVPDAMSGYLKSQFQKISYPSFAILTYRVPMKGYMPIVHNLERYAPENIVISLRSGFFRTIFGSPGGLIVKSSSIEDDLFLTKLFQAKDGHRKPLYFVMLNSVTDELERELAIPGIEATSPFFPAAICMIEIQESDAKNEALRITNILKKRLSFPFLFLNNKLSQDYSLRSFKGLTNAFHLLDYFFTIFIIRGEGVGFKIRFSGPRGTTASFLMKYMISKLNHVLSADSAIVHFFKNQLLILTKDSRVESIAGIVDSHNSLFDEKLSMTKFYAKDYDDSIQLIQDLILTN